MSSNEISKENFKKSIEYQRLKSTIYSKNELFQIENDENKITYFYDYVLPSLSTQVVSPGGCSAKRWICFEEFCLEKQSSYASKQVFIRHIIEKHGHLLPGNGDFLSNQNTVGCRVFTCIHCKTSFNRKEHLVQHFKSSIHLRNVEKNSADKAELAKEEIINKSINDLKLITKEETLHSKSRDPEYYDGESIGNETKKFKYDFNNESEDEDLLNFLKTCKY
jgi:hypothetical protein